MMQRADAAIIKADFSHIARISELERNCIPNGWSENAFREALGSPGKIILAAVCSDSVIGFLNGSYILDEGELLNIAVSENYRRIGIAGMLIDRFEQELKIKDVNKVYLEVREGNIPARNFYEKHGYKQNGLRKNYYRSPVENAVLMVRNLY